LGLPDAPPDNAELALASGGLTNDFTQAFVVTPSNRVQMPKNSHSVAITSLNAASGLFSGSFVLTDDDPRDMTPPIAQLKRTTKFEGVLVAPLNLGVGHFQLAKLPATSTENVNNTPTLSGQVTLRARSP
jgi:hypothetical protein